MDELRNEPILLAHHPLCGRFDDHLLTIRGRKICRGCVTVYPTFLVMLALLFLGRPTFEVVFLGSIILFSFQLLRFVTSGRGLSIIFNMVLGSSLALAIYSAIVCPPDLRIYVYPFLITVIIVFEYLKGRRMLNKCKDCSNRASYPKCARGPMKIDDSK
ncbi:MAG: hypothetical protein AB9860_03160 [Methanomassiliicoccales archaeon]